MKKMLLVAFGLTLLASCDSGSSEPPKPEASVAASLSTNQYRTYTWRDINLHNYQKEYDCAQYVETWPMTVKTYLTNSYYDENGYLIATETSQFQATRLSGEVWFTSKLEQDGAVNFQWGELFCQVKEKGAMTYAEGSCENSDASFYCKFGYDY